MNSFPKRCFKGFLLRWIILCAVLFITLPVALSDTITVIDKAPPAPQGLAIYVNDLGQIIDDADEEKLKTYLAQVDESGFGQIIVLTLPDTHRELSDFTPEIMNQWGIGHHNKDDGVLILANAKRIRENLSGNRIFIGSGNGVEGLLPDAVLGRILDQYALPAFQEQQYSAGVVQTALVVSKILQGDQSLASSLSSATAGSESPPPWLVFLFVVIVILMRLKGIPIYIGGGGFGGGGGFSGGFGGGSSGGGGAGR